MGFAPKTRIRFILWMAGYVAAVILTSWAFNARLIPGPAVIPVDPKRRHYLRVFD